jgi:hypothetical protein
MAVQPEETRNIYDRVRGLRTCKGRIENSPTWTVVDVEKMSEIDSIIFYLRSKVTHKYRNVLDEVVMDLYETRIRVEGDLIHNHPHEAAGAIMKYASGELKVAKDCI